MRYTNTQQLIFILIITILGLARLTEAAVSFRQKARSLSRLSDAGDLCAGGITFSPDWYTTDQLQQVISGCGAVPVGGSCSVLAPQNTFYYCGVVIPRAAGMPGYREAYPQNTSLWNQTLLNCVNAHYGCDPYVEGDMSNIYKFLIGIGGVLGGVLVLFCMGAAIYPSYFEMRS